MIAAAALSFGGMLISSCIPAGKLHLTYCAVYMLIKRPFISLGIGNASNVTMPAECREAIKASVDIFDVIDPSNLLCGWSLSSKLSTDGIPKQGRVSYLGKEAHMSNYF